jgi:hypothetical protein
LVVLVVEVGCSSSPSSSERSRMKRSPRWNIVGVRSSYASDRGIGEDC